MLWPLPDKYRRPGKVSVKIV